MQRNNSALAAAPPTHPLFVRKATEFDARSCSKARKVDAETRAGVCPCHPDEIEPIHLRLANIVLDLANDGQLEIIRRIRSRLMRRHTTVPAGRRHQNAPAKFGRNLEGGPMSRLVNSLARTEGAIRELTGRIELYRNRIARKSRKSCVSRTSSATPSQRECCS